MEAKLHRQIITDAGEVDMDVLRQIVHEYLAGTLSEEDEEALGAGWAGRYLSFDGIEDDRVQEIDIEELAVESVQLGSAFFGRSRTSGYDDIEAYNFGYRQWYIHRLYASDDTEGEYVDPASDLETLFRKKQREWLADGVWVGSALTDFSARDDREPWFIRELTGINVEWGDLDIFHDARIGTGEAIPEGLAAVASEYWTDAVVHEPDNGDVQFGRWNPTSTAFNRWLKGRTVRWRDTGAELTRPEAIALRSVCLRLGMLEERLYNIF